AGEPGDLGAVRETYVNLGRGEFHAGRSLENLLAAYRVGARVTWRRFVEAGTAGGITAEELFAVGEQIFAYIDTLSSESAEGYAREQRAEAGERRRSRARLVELLAAGADDETVRGAATAAGWELPREVAALAVDALRIGVPGGPSDVIAGVEDVAEAAERLGRDIGPGVVATSRDGIAVLLVGDPEAPARRRLIRRAVGPRRAVLGPTVPLPRADHSLRRALETLRLTAAPGLTDAAEHLPALMLGADLGLAAELAAHRLAPLDALAPGAATRLAVTLRAWLDRPGQVQAIAAEIGVHPQTVRYRVRQLRDLFGDRLDDPDARFELSLALRARALAG
ncbi:MAG: hypothetical protein QOF76_4331, partial [Solirubrobacteraceae bacterium]|nr:hypothetical protein [Solirubrobacteraceae bacterium]